MVPEEIILILIIIHKNKRIVYIYFNNLDNLMGTPYFHTEVDCMPQRNRKLCWLMQLLLTRSRWTGQTKSVPQWLDTHIESNI